MAKPRLFYTGSVRIISDASITATEHRVYACVSLHDGMSLLKGKGAGCYASNVLLAQEVGCDYSTLCKALTRLETDGYLVKSKSGDDRRMTVYRVAFPTPDEWQAHHITTPANSGEGSHLGGEVAHPEAEIGGEAFSEIFGNPPKPDRHYIPLKGELDSVETGEIDSVETARLSSQRLGRKKVKFADNDGAQLAVFERAWNAKRFTDEQLSEWLVWLEPFAQDPDPDDPNNQRACRLHEAVDYWLWENCTGIYTGRNIGDAA